MKYFLIGFVLSFVIGMKAFARILHHVADYLEYAIRVMKLPDCNTCGKRDGCEHRPDWGDPVRINCPLYEEGVIVVDGEWGKK